MMCSFTEEFKTLKLEFVRLKEKILIIETQFHHLENSISSLVTAAASGREKQTSLPEYYLGIDGCRMYTEKMMPSLQNLDKQTRNIIEELMWESTLSKAVLQVRETFKDGYSREMFLRYSLEMVLEKDEQYRKMIGTLFGHLLTQNVVNQINVFNSLCSVLLVMENSNSYNTHMWQNLTEILLPMITESHITILQLQRKAQAILKHEYYREFTKYLTSALDRYRGQKFEHGSITSETVLQQQGSTAFPHTVISRNSNNVTTQKNLIKLDVAANADAELFRQLDLCDLESLSKCKMLTEETEVDKYATEIENLVFEFASGGNSGDALHKIKKLLLCCDVNAMIDKLIDIALQKETEHRLAVGTILAKLAHCSIGDVKQVLISLCRHALAAQKLILNPNTRLDVCTAFADILSPLVSLGRIHSSHLDAIASALLPDEIRTIFVWLVEKLLRDKDVGLTSSFIPREPNLLTKKSQKPEKKDCNDNGEHYNQEVDRCEKAHSKTRNTFLVQNDIPIDIAIETHEQSGNPDTITDAGEQETYLLLKRKKLLKERIENLSDPNDLKIEDLLNAHNTKKTQDGDINFDTVIQVKVDQTKADNDLLSVKQPENLPSSAIKEKMEEIIEHLMETDNMDGCVTTIRDTFNEYEY